VHVEPSRQVVHVHVERRAYSVNHVAFTPSSHGYLLQQVRGIALTEVVFVSIISGVDLLQIRRLLTSSGCNLATLSEKMIFTLTKNPSSFLEEVLFLQYFRNTRNTIARNNKFTLTRLSKSYFLQL
jgi:hypothetical protein